MRETNPTGHEREPAAFAAGRAVDNGGFVEIATLSLAGLTVALFQIAHYVGTTALPQMLTQ